jgi:hypothetical protein
MGFWMQRDRPKDASREPTITSQSRRLHQHNKKRNNVEEKKMWQRSQRSERRPALQCNRKINGRLKSLERKKKRKEIIVTERLVRDASGNGRSLPYSIKVCRFF